MSLLNCETPAATTTAGAPALRILGLDLSITATGVCLPDGTTQTIVTQQKTGDARLKVIEHAITEATFDVDFAVIEDLPTHAKSAGITGMVHGVARLVLLRYGIPYAVVTPATLKAYATGKGNADKTAMAIAALKRTGREFADDNQCDAFWLRAAGLDWYEHAEFTMPAAQRDRLAKVTWPEREAVTTR